MITSNNNKIYQLVFFSAAALYLELAIIRFTAAEVLYLGYFSNFILISTFVGLGLGFLSVNKKNDFHIYIPFILLFMFSLVLVSEIDVSILKDHFGLFYFGNVQGRAGIPGAILLFILFLSTVFLFIGIGNRIACAFKYFVPLKAYTWDITGSLIGIGIFSLQSLSSSGPVVWIITGCLLLSLGYLFSNDENTVKNIFSIAISLFCIITLLYSSHTGIPTLWSPYQKLEIYPYHKVEFDDKNDIEVINAKLLYANGIPHQFLFSAERAKKFFYDIPYQLKKENGGNLDDVLIVGAGTGTDVAVALSNEVGSIDAVEIDAKIAQVGQLFHPDLPYSSPRVKLHVADGRQYLRHTDKKYDLILFALPDSLMRLSAISSVRLESYLFTLEAFSDVKKHLKDDGLFVLYNQYRWPWLVNKISAAMETVFEKPPRIEKFADTTVIAVGPSLEGKPAIHEGYSKFANDDWPFIYMQRPGIHWLYIGMIGMFLLFSLLGVYWLAPRGTLLKPEFPFFFMGIAFLLLETKSLALFSLLFGTTWFVNSLAFTGILISVLIANLLVQNFNIRRRPILYSGLFLCLFIAYMIPVNLFLDIESALLRYILVVVLIFSPIFFANLIFSREFKDAEESTRAFGWNLIGAVVGGGLEYLSLLLGFRNLLLIVALCYLMAAVFTRSEQMASL